MMNASIDNLLVRYQRTPSDEAFRELVSRHSGLVHATATRLLSGDQSAADDVSQQVFLRLLKKAPSLPPRICMAGWLYRQTSRISSDFRRASQRRRAREHAALTIMTDQDSEKFTDEVDEALASLPEEDRNIILLRYFDEQSHRAVGDSLGISEDAARKRCARAVEALRSFFGRKGQAFSTGTLGIFLTGLASKPLSAGTVTKMLPQTIGLASKTSPLLSFAAGLALAGISASGIIWVTQKPGQETGVGGAPAKISKRRVQAERGSSLKELKFQSIEIVIAQVRFLARSPRNTITMMKLEALFDSIPADQRREFFAEARDVLSIAEKRFSYSGFIKIWMTEAPAKAMNLCLDQDIENQLNDSSTHLVQNLFADWFRKDPAVSSDWLRENWQNPALDAPGFPHSLKVAMSHDVLRKTLNSEGVAAAFEAAKKIGDPEDFRLVSEAITGTLWHQIRADQGAGIYRYLINLPESTQRDEMIQEFIGNWKRFTSGSATKVIAAMEEMEPSERLTLELALLGEFVRETQDKVLADGGIRTEFLGEDPTEEDRALRRKEREEGFRETARLAGLNQEQANLMIAESYLANERDDATPILKALPPSPELDQAIWKTIRGEKTVNLRGSAKHELKAFRYAQHLSSPDERDQVSRALFRRIIVKNPHDARALLANPDLSPGMLETLQEVALQSSL